MKTLFVEGNTVFHRLSPRAKLLLLVAASVALFLTRQPLLLGAALLAALVAYATLGLGLAAGFRRLRPLLLSILLLALFTLLVDSAETALVAALRLTTLALAAATVTAATPVADFMDEVTRLAAPLERLGLLKAADLGLAFGLTLRFLPEILDRHAAIRDAHAARGLKASFRTVTIPLVILTLRDADQIAAAIDARRIRPR